MMTHALKLAGTGGRECPVLRLLLPEPVILFSMAMYPQESGQNCAESMLGNGGPNLVLPPGTLHTLSS